MKREGYYRIGEVSKITGISKDTLHFYNKIGLVVPDCTDPENQYRICSRWNMWQMGIVTIWAFGCTLRKHTRPPKRAVGQ